MITVDTQSTDSYHTYNSIIQTFCFYLFITIKSTIPCHRLLIVDVINSKPFSKVPKYKWAIFFNLEVAWHILPVFKTRI